MRKLLRNTLFSSEYSDKIISIAVYLLLVFGLISQTSAAINAKSDLSSTISDFIKSGIIIVASVVIYHFVSNVFSMEKLTLSRTYKIAALELGLLLFAVICCSRFLFGPIHGNYSWIHIPHVPFTIQPSEFAKVVMILVVATFFCDKKFNGINSTWTIINKPLMILLAYEAIIFVLQKDNGSALVVGMISCLVLLIPNHRLLRLPQILVLIGAVGVVAAYLYLMTEGGQAFLTKIGFAHVAARFQAVKTPSYTSDATREIFYSLLGISKGGVAGVGLGDSVQKFGYLVSSSADYIFAIIAEETGLIGIGLVFGLYGIIIYRLIHFSKIVTRESEKVVLIGTVSYLFIHFFLNVGGVSGLIPLTGVPLLLLSKGGSATLSIMLMLGLSQAVIHNHQKARKQKRDLII